MTITVGGTNITLNSGSVIQDPPGTAPSYLCRAWVNFNGTGTVSIRASGNVSSITDNGVGDYTVNFTTAMPDTNYCATGLVKEYDSTSGSAIWLQPATQTIANTYQTGWFRVNARYGAGNSDVAVANVAVFR